MNNNLAPSSKAKCKCGRHMTLGEDKAGCWYIGYKCPDCLYFENTGVNTIEQYNNWLMKNKPS